MIFPSSCATSAVVERIAKTTANKVFRWFMSVVCLSENHPAFGGDAVDALNEDEDDSFRKVLLLGDVAFSATMKGATTEQLAEQARRLAAKTQDQRMINKVVSGTGMSPWEAARNCLATAGRTSEYLRQSTRNMTVSRMRSMMGLLATAGWALGVSSCGLMPPKSPPKARVVWFEWADDGGPGELVVTLDLARQIATFERGGRPIGWSYICSGKPGHASRPGEYTITEKKEVQFSDRYGWLADETGKVTNGDATPATRVPPGEHYSPSPMYHWMRLTNYGMGMHAGEIRVPGVAASHGCVRLPTDLATKLYETAVLGTPVKIVGPDDGKRQAGKGAGVHDKEVMRLSSVGLVGR